MTAPTLGWEKEGSKDTVSGIWRRRDATRSSAARLRLEDSSRPRQGGWAVPALHSPQLGAPREPQGWTSEPPKHVGSGGSCQPRAGPGEGHRCESSAASARSSWETGAPAQPRSRRRPPTASAVGDMQTASICSRTAPSSRSKSQGSVTW